MELINYIVLFLVALTVSLVIDLFWLVVVARDLYKKYMGDYLAKKPRKSAALLFYTLFIVGLMYFALIPAINEDSYFLAIKNGLLYGFFTYITYDLTALSVFPAWSKRLTVIDIVWGSFLGLTVSSISFLIYLIIF